MKRQLFNLSTVANFLYLFFFQNISFEAIQSAVSLLLERCERRSVVASIELCGCRRLRTLILDSLTDFRPNEIARSITLRYAGRCSLMLKYRFATFAGLLSLSRPRSSLHLAL